jgi:hypothetical protein
LLAHCLTSNFTFTRPVHRPRRKSGSLPSFHAEGDENSPFLSNDGGNPSGEFYFTLTDVALGWTVHYPLRNKAHMGIYHYYKHTAFYRLKRHSCEHLRFRKMDIEEFVSFGKIFT